jgi:hypothetical protein
LLIEEGGAGFNPFPGAAFLSVVSKTGKVTFHGFLNFVRE